MKKLNYIVWCMAALLFVIISILGVNKIYAVDANGGNYDLYKKRLDHGWCWCDYNGRRVRSIGMKCTNTGNTCFETPPICFCDSYNIELAERLISPY